MKNILITENNNNINKKNTSENIIPTLPKEKKIANIYQEIMANKGMTNKIVMKLFLKLEILHYYLKYLIYDVGDFRLRLQNTLNINSIIVANLLANKLSVYLSDFRLLYNHVFKNWKEFEETLKKIKNDSIPTIAKNLNKLKEQPSLKEEEIKILDELSKTLDDYIIKVNELDKKYEDQNKDFITSFICFMNLIEEIKKKF